MIYFITINTCNNAQAVFINYWLTTLKSICSMFLGTWYLTCVNRSSMQLIAVPMTVKLCIMYLHHIRHHKLKSRFKKEFWLVSFAYLVKTLLTIEKCLHLLILHPILNQSSHLIAKSLMLPMLGKQPLSVTRIRCHWVIALILILRVHKNNWNCLSDFWHQ